MSVIAGWQTKRLDEIGEIISGSTPSTSISSFWNGDIVWITPYDLSRLKSPYLVDSSKKITAAGLAGTSTHLLPPKSLVMSSRAPIGYLALPAVDFCTNQGCKSFKLKPEINPVFAYYNVSFNMHKIKNLGEGTTFAEISKTALATVEMDFPESYLEQIRIAEVLATVDQAIEQTEALIAKQQRIKTGLMQDLLTRGIDEYGQLRTEQTHSFKDSLLGRIPVEWEVNSLDKLTSEIVDCPHTTPHFLPSGVLVARTFNLKDGQFVGAKSYVSEAEYETRISRLEPHAGDVIFTREAPVGEAFVVPSEMKICLGQRTMQIRCKQVCLLPEFFVEFVYSEETRIRFDQMVGGTTNPHLNVSDVRALLLRAPSIDEQKRIVEKIAAVRGAIQQSLSQKEKLSVLKTALMQDLLTGRKRVTDLLEPIAA